MLKKVACVAVLMGAACGAAFAGGTAGVWLDVPFVAQTKDGCGAATLAMVMQYWERHEGRPTSAAADPEQILRVLYAKQAHGIYASAMVDYLKANGYRTFAFTGDWAMVADHLRHGRPLIAAVRPEGSHALHYVVVAGVEPERHVVVVNDPEQRRLMKVDETIFEHEWKATGHWTLLAVPAGGAR
ncbi:MAG TPA: C39 family peptidase [Terracidiphilus sp.]|nr:C39 family peptidase [Terracidiphilus sp.]